MPTDELLIYFFIFSTFILLVILIRFWPFSKPVCTDQTKKAPVETNYNNGNIPLLPFHHQTIQDTQRTNKSINDMTVKS